VIRANQLRELLFEKGGDLSSITKEEVQTLFGVELQKGPVAIDAVSPKATDILVQLGVFDSKGQAKRAIEGGGVQLNGKKVNDVDHVIRAQDLLHGRYMIVRKGKKDHMLLILDFNKVEEEVEQR